MSNRTVARWTARMLGYFWLPCPTCGLHFGGHEIGKVLGHRDSIPDPGEAGTSWCICSDCTAEGKGCAAHAAHDPVLILHDCEPTRTALVEHVGQQRADAMLAALAVDE